MEAQGSCMVPVADGAHTIRALRGDGSDVEAPINHPGSGLHWFVGETGLVEY